MRLHRFVLSLALAVLAAVTTQCQEHQHGAPPPAAASTAHAGTTVTFPSTIAGNASGYLALPDGGGKHPGIIVVQEWWGVNDWVKEQADRFAKQGYVALAVDLYRGRVATTQDEAHELMRGMPEDRAVADLKAGVDFL